MYMDLTKHLPNAIAARPCIAEGMVIGVQVILMDHVDWQDLTAAKDLAQVLARQVVPGGRVIWRSAAHAPKYAQLVREAGFDVQCLQRAEEGYMDRVNMYSSFYVAVRRGPAHLANGS